MYRREENGIHYQSKEVFEEFKRKHPSEYKQKIEESKAKAKKTRGENKAREEKARKKRSKEPLEEKNGREKRKVVGKNK